MPDHVHMMISIPPKYAVSQVVGPIIKAPGSAGGYLPRLIAVSPGRPGRRRDHPWLGAAVHRVGFAIAAVARDRGHALLVGPKAAVAPAAISAAVLGTPRIGDLGARGFAVRRESQQSAKAERMRCMSSLSQ
jgi:hypothetical protein